MDFPIFKTKISGDKKVFDLNDPVERRKYFDHKAGAEIEKLRDYLRNNTFVGFLIGKKASGKGAYSRLFAEAVGSDYIHHVSVGDIVRKAEQEKNLEKELKKIYRGAVSLKSALKVFSNRSTKTLLPTELILALVQREISKIGRKAVFIDGFPRQADQVSYSLYFRALIGYRNDPDFFVFIDVPEKVIDERLRYRVVCPKCQLSRNLKLLPTKQVKYDKEFYLICENDGARMICKEGDKLGIQAIRNRIKKDEKVMKDLIQLDGVGKIYLRNAIPIKQAKKYVNNYELTKACFYKYQNKQVQIIKKPWIINKSYSLLAPPVVIFLIKQVTKILDL